MSITIRSVTALGPGEAIWDDSVKGFGCRRQRKQPTYILKFRHQGRQRLLTIGPHGAPWTPETARREAKRLLGQVAAGKDPTPAGRDSLSAVARDYLEAARPRLKPRSYTELERKSPAALGTIREREYLRNNAPTSGLTCCGTGNVLRSGCGSTCKVGPWRDVQLGTARGIRASSESSCRKQQPSKTALSGKGPHRRGVVQGLACMR